MYQNNTYLKKENVKEQFKKLNDEYKDISQITESIFIGNKFIAQDICLLNAKGITHVINCGHELKHITDLYNDIDIDWLWLPMYDNTFDSDAITYFEETIEYMDKQSIIMVKF